MDWVPLPAAVNPLLAVRRSTEEVVRRSRHVKIVPEVISQIATKWNSQGSTSGLGVGWDAGVHYGEDAEVGGPLTAQYVFVLGTREAAARTKLYHMWDPL